MVVYHSGTFKDEQIVTYEQRRSSFVLPGALFEQDYYRQVGWSTWPYSFYPEYEFGDIYRTGTSTVHLYAIWDLDWHHGYSMSSMDGIDGGLFEDSLVEDSPTPSAPVTPPTPSPVLSPTPSSAPSPTPSPTATVSGGAG